MFICYIMISIHVCMCVCVCVFVCVCTFVPLKKQQIRILMHLQLHIHTHIFVLCYTHQTYTHDVAQTKFRDIEPQSGGECCETCTRMKQGVWNKGYETTHVIGYETGTSDLWFSYLLRPRIQFETSHLCLWKRTVFYPRAFALQNSSMNSSPAPDFVFFKLINSSVCLLLRRVFSAQTPVSLSRPPCL